MAIKSVADSPFFANLSTGSARWFARAQKVPLRYYRVAIIAFAALWAVYVIASQFWVLLPPPALPLPAVTASSVSVDTSSRADVDIAPTQALNLFGAFGAEPIVEVEPEPEQEENHEITKIQVDLQGVIAGSVAERSWAIIGRGDNQKLYKVGDELEIARGVKVAKIQELKVVLDNNGKFEDLWLFGEDGKDFAVTKPSAARPKPAPSPQQAAVIRPEQIKQAKNIGDVVRFMVATENGKMIGYKVRPGRQRELFDQVGLKTDDIVVSVNGIEVNEPQKVREVYQALKNATEANLEVLRDGSTHSIQITMGTEG